MRIKILIILPVIVFAAIFAFAKISFSDSRVITLTNLAGDVKAETANGSKVIQAFRKMRLVQGDTLAVGEKAWATLSIDSDKEVLVSENTRLKIDELTGTKNDLGTVLALESGKVWTKIKEKLSRDSTYEVKTPTATMSVRGTQFYVNSSEEGTKVAVLDGTVWASTTLPAEDTGDETKEAVATLVIEKNKELTIVQGQSTSREELKNQIRDVNILAFDAETLNFIKKDPEGIDEEILNKINEYIIYK